MTHVGEQDLERMEQARLEGDLITELATTARECTFLFTAEDGWPAGVTMSHLYADGLFWLTSVDTRAQVRAARRDPRVGLVISSLGTDLDGRRMARVKGHAEVLDDPGTRARMLPRISEHLAPGGAERLHGLLDSPGRVLIRVEPVSFPQTHDSRRIAGDGRGGARG